MPVTDRPQVMLASRVVYNSALPLIYRSINYLDGELPSRDTFPLLHDYAKAQDPLLNTQVIQPESLVRTIQENPVESQ